MEKDKEIVLHDDYPFRNDVLNAQQYGTGKYIREQVLADGSRQKITVLIEKEFNKTPFIMLYQHKQMLEDLEPAACKILIHMAINMGYGAQQVEIKRKETGLSKRVFSRAMVTLMFNRVLRKVANKREWYWVNITILIMGITKKLEQ